ncbi:MAG: hypothetical protein B6V02_02435 [Thermoprotei archaeon ex4572_64]|nr:MAG: hypothetical protein B6V02_02435 [Thermoprotei archaeon ex4572_64]
MKRILLDTSFILPILGISVSKEVDESLLKISKYELYISRSLLGHNDLIDCLLYSTAINLNLQFLTIDEEFRRFIKRAGLKDVTITLQDIL